MVAAVGSAVILPVPLTAAVVVGNLPVPLCAPVEVGNLPDEVSVSVKAVCLPVLFSAVVVASMVIPLLVLVEWPGVVPFRPVRPDEVADGTEEVL
jgi:hypothetical protein